jgi:hypothetical protein
VHFGSILADKLFVVNKGRKYFSAPQTGWDRALYSGPSL